MRKYTIIETAWGWAGFSADGGGITRLALPAASQRAAKAVFVGLEFDPELMKDTQKAIVRYFEGEKVDFGGWPKVNLDGIGEFGKAILSACRTIGYGKTSTYGELAEMAGCPGAARAVGTALANNPVPLIVPCHRVLRSDGGLGGYSGEGGIHTKQRLLVLENHTWFPFPKAHGP